MDLSTSYSFSTTETLYPGEPPSKRQRSSGAGSESVPFTPIEPEGKAAKTEEQDDDEALDFLLNTMNGQEYLPDSPPDDEPEPVPVYSLSEKLNGQILDLYRRCEDLEATIQYDMQKYVGHLKDLPYYEKEEKENARASPLPFSQELILPPISQAEKTRRAMRVIVTRTTSVFRSAMEPLEPLFQAFPQQHYYSTRPSNLSEAAFAELRQTYVSAGPPQMKGPKPTRLLAPSPAQRMIDSREKKVAPTEFPLEFCHPYNPTELLVLKNQQDMTSLQACLDEFRSKIPFVLSWPKPGDKLTGIKRKR